MAASSLSWANSQTLAPCRPESIMPGLIEGVYGHLMKVPNRTETVEYREADVRPMKERATG